MVRKNPILKNKYFRTAIDILGIIALIGGAILATDQNVSEALYLATILPILKSVIRALE